MVMDPDYNPEGAQQKATLVLHKDQKIGFTAGEFVILENYNAGGTGPNNDPFLFMGQIDWSAKWTDKLSSRVGVAAYAFDHQNAGSTNLESFLNQGGTPAFGPGAQNFNPMTFNVRFMRTEQINNAPGTSAKQTRMFADLVWAF